MSNFCVIYFNIKFINLSLYGEHFYQFFFHLIISICISFVPLCSFLSDDTCVKLLCTLSLHDSCVNLFSYPLLRSLVFLHIKSIFLHWCNFSFLHVTIIYLYSFSFEWQNLVTRFFLSVVHFCWNLSCFEHWKKIIGVK